MESSGVGDQGWRGLVGEECCDGQPSQGAMASIVASSRWGTFPTCQCAQVGEGRHVRNVPHVLPPPAFRKVMIKAGAMAA